MAEDALQKKLVAYVEDAHAMETNVLRMLDSMIKTTDDAEMKKQLEQHKKQTERHEERLRQRLEKLGGGTSTRKQAQTMAGAVLKGLTDQVRGDKAGKNARDGFVTEHMEIAAYELLERLAIRAGDKQTARVAQMNKRDEEAMAKKIAASWDKVVELTLEENGIEAPRGRLRGRLSGSRTGAKTRSASGGRSTSRRKATARSR